MFQREGVTNNFVEGFINFEAVNEGTPSLVVPYIGYYGDWSEEQIIDGAAWDNDNYIWFLALQLLQY